MKKNQFTQAMIETGIDRAFDEIRENSYQGIQKLLNLGNIFISNEILKKALHALGEKLKNQSSPYYPYLDDILHHVSEETLKRLAINLIGNMWSSGRTELIDREQMMGFTVPWLLIFDFRDPREPVLSEKETERIIVHGENIGIPVSIIFTGDNRNQLRNVLNIVIRHPDSVFLLLMKPAMIDDSVADLFTKAPNLAIALENPLEEEEHWLQEITEKLRGRKCLYGGYSESENETMLSPQDVSQKLTKYHFLFHLLIQNDSNKKRYSRYINTWNNAGLIPLQSDFYADIAEISRLITGQDSFLAIFSDGSVAIDSLHNRVKDVNARTQSLEHILKKTLFKMFKANPPAP